MNIIVALFLGAGLGLASNQPKVLNIEVAVEQPNVYSQYIDRWTNNVIKKQKELSHEH